MERPSGTVTFLFTDVEGSARLWDEHPKAMRTALARHEGLLHEAISAHDGYVFKLMGDEFRVAFSRPTDALAAALDGQRALQAEAWPVGPLRVRMALHSGEAEERGGDYFGPSLNRCARMLAAGHGGQVLLSHATAHLVREALPAGAELRPLGEHRLRDLTQPEDISQLVHPDLAADFLPLRSLAAFVHNLPLQLTSFVGREQELDEVKRLLADTRLLTLTGTGGAGKTRLALQVAADLLDECPNGVWLVELATLSDPSPVAQAVLSALGLREEPQRAPIDTLVDSLRPKRLLLILDNCEHLVGACAELAERLLRGGPGVRVLATSREVLRAAGEVVWRVPSLSVPPRDAERPTPVEQVTQYEAVRLFIERAVAVDPGFRVTDANAPAVAETCWRLDGIPLAIELAAARLGAMSVAEIRARLSDRFALLTTGLRTVLPRQQTLRAAIDWSYELLSDPERVLLRRLSVFAGGWAIEAAERVATDPGLAQPLVLDLLTGLADKSLVVVEQQERGVRYRLLETIREYGRDQLARAGEEPAVCGRHRSYFLGLAEQGAEVLRGPNQSVWLERLEVEHDNLRAALASCRGEAGQAETAVRLCAALWGFWYMHGHVTEGRAWLAEALARSPEPTTARARALAGGGSMARLQADYEQATALLTEALALSRQLGDSRLRAAALNNLASVVRDQGDYRRAGALFEESRDLLRTLGDEGRVALLTTNLGVIAHEQGDYARAAALYEEALTLSRALGDKHNVAMALNNLGNIRLSQGDAVAAHALLQESLAMRREAGLKEGVATCLVNLGNVVVLQGDSDAARSYYRESLLLFRELGQRGAVPPVLAGLAQVARQEQDLARSARLLAASSAVREALRAPLPPNDRDAFDSQVEDIRVSLGDDAFAAAWADGCAMTLDQAVTYAVEEGDDA